MFLRDNLLEYYDTKGAMDMWERQLIETKNGQFEIFVAGEGSRYVLRIYIVSSMEMEAFTRANLRRIAKCI
mgnify:CR=1 FL=1